MAGSSSSPCAARSGSYSVISRLLLLFAALFWSAPALADYAPTVRYAYQGAYYDSPAAFCNATRWPQFVSWEIRGSYPQHMVIGCWMVYPSGSPSQVDLFVSEVCQFGGTLQNHMCIGGEGPPPKCVPGPGGYLDITTAWGTGSSVGSAIRQKVVPDGGAAGRSYCVGGCLMVTQAPDSGSSCKIEQTASANGYFRIHCTLPTENSGGECVPSQNGPDNPNPPEPTGTGTKDGKCPAGSTPSGQDSMGMTICTGTSKPPEPPKTDTSKPPVTTQNPDGGSTTVSETSTTNSDGSTTTTKTTTTTASDGSKTTTTTSSTTKPDGSPGQPDKPDSDLCKQNPALTICRNSQVMGKCGDITCDGDAIQCATLRAAAAMECRQQEDMDKLEKSSQYALGNQVLNGTDPAQAQIDALMKGNTVDFSAHGQLSEAAFLSSRCISPKSFQVMGRTIVADFSAACADIEPLKYAVLALAYIAAYLIVSKSVLQG